MALGSEERFTNELTPSAAGLAARLAAQRPDPRLASLLARYPDAVFSQQLYASIEAADRLATELAIISANSVGFLPHLSVPRTVAELRDAAGLTESFTPALSWLLQRLVSAGRLAVDTAGAERRFTGTGLRRAANAAAGASADAAVVRAAALLIDPANAATCDLLEMAAAAYPAIACGRSSGRDALLGIGQVDLWLRYFSNANPLYAVNNWIAATAAADRLAARAVQSAGVRILEIGAGAGSGSERLLERVQHAGLAPQLAGYRITEPSALFARKSQRLLSPYRGLPLSFAGLDIDRPWREQGIDDGAFDLVYAVNVLHVARDLSFTLGEARRALAPGGWLVAGECLRPDADAALYVELAFRLLEDPAAITDPFRRPHPGFLEWRHWQAALGAAGFSAVTAEPDVARVCAIYPKLFVAAVCARA